MATHSTPVQRTGSGLPGPAEPSGADEDEPGSTGPFGVLECAGLVERNEEMAALDSAFAGRPPVGSRVVVISGGVATGKTALLRAFGERVVESGAAFLSAVASRAERNLPLGVLEQLLQSPGLPRAGAEDATRWPADAGESGAVLGEPGSGGTGPVTSPVLRGFREILRDLVARGPVVIGVDDAHHADEASLQCLLYLMRRLRSPRLRLVFCESTHHKASNALLRSEFLREPFLRYVRLAPLTKTGVADMLSRHLGVDVQTVHDLTPAFHEMSAGYPLLLQALIDDYLAHPPAAPGELAAGETFSRAVLSYLYRHEPPVMVVARAVAVMGRAAPRPLLARLLDMDTASICQVVNLLALAEVLEDGRFRHEAFRTAVLDSIPVSERGALHARVADLLHNEGEAATEVAAHLVAADQVAAPWVVPILEEAAEQALSGDDVNTSIRYLRAAHQLCDDERQRQTIVSALADAEWRVDPSQVLRRLHEFGTADREGPGDRSGASPPVTYLLWHGRVGEAFGAIDSLTRGRDGAGGTRAGTAMDLDTPRLWGAYLYPGCFKQQPGTDAPTAMNPQLQGTDVLVAELVHGRRNNALGAAGAILRRYHLGHRTFAPLATALAVLTYNDRLDEAAAWCDSLLSEAVARRSPTWHAMFAAERALIHLRQGNLIAAERQADSALCLIPPKSWGAAVGLPLAVMVLAKTALGDVERAAAFLDIAVPEAMFQTRTGLHYLYARGRHYLATDCAHIALCDFYACGKLMGDWGIDLPEVEPWRLGAAEAYLAMGDPDKARRLADEQLALLAPGHIRTRGMSLRSQAATRDVKSRAPLLREAADTLSRCGDRFELAQVLADQSRACQLLGDDERARALARKAHGLARECGIRTPDQIPAFENTDRGHTEPGHDTSPGHPATELSDAQRRVAALAAEGFTNREISRKLYITVSTVEQHLTKIYRKLNVTRIDLQAALQHHNLQRRNMES